MPSPTTTSSTPIAAVSPPNTSIPLRRCSLTAHILHTLDTLSGFAERQEDRAVLQAVERHVRRGVSDSEHIRQMLHNGLPQTQVIKRLCDELLQPAS